MTGSTYSVRTAVSQHLEAGSSGVVEDDWDVASPSALITHASDELVYPSVRSSGMDHVNMGRSRRWT